jgi:succinoglycan biosynthesis protein ExoU
MPPEDESARDASVCVVIAAMNASATIGRAIRSALSEPEVGEVIVVDDGSSDETAAAARASDDGSGRLKVLSLSRNFGPSHARNRAIEVSRSDLLAILDADDFILPGRFRRLLSQPRPWDFIADNILLVDSAKADQPLDVAALADDAETLTTAAFIEGNISRPGIERAEIGFLKPVLRRAFLDRHGLRYDETMRLGEDYDLYVRALASGARYRVVRSCGYGATVRADSLSSRHRTEDLKALYEADQRIRARYALTEEEAAALRRHEESIRARYELRRFLDRKKEAGLARAGFELLRRPRAVWPVASGVLRDKRLARTARHAPAADLPRYLLPARAAD